MKFAEKCLTALGLPSKTEVEARACYSGREGEGLLIASAQETAGLGVSKSCTIWVDEKPRCVYDGGMWCVLLSCLFLIRSGADTEVD